MHGTDFSEIEIQRRREMGALPPQDVGAIRLSQLAGDEIAIDQAQRRNGWCAWGSLTSAPTGQDSSAAATINGQKQRTFGVIMTLSLVNGQQPVVQRQCQQ